MNTRLLLYILLLLFIFQYPVYAQEKLSIKFGKVAPEDFEITSSLIDSNTNAVVVADVGRSEFIANANDLTFSLLFTRKTRIKILNKMGYDAATVIIPLYVSSSGKAEKLEALKAYTYNLENGDLTETALGKSDIFTEKQNKNLVYKKFTFPAIKEGSILEYSYQVKSDFLFNFQPWAFQGKYPVLWSQYTAGIPQFFNYVFLSQGPSNFYINKNDQSITNFTFIDQVEKERGALGSQANAGQQMFKVSGLVDSHTWVMKDLPGLKMEPFTTTIKNAIAKIEFQLNLVKYPNSAPVNYMNTWEKVARELMASEDFGVPLTKGNNWLDDKVADIIKSAVTQTEKAKRIYDYLRDNFSVNKQSGIFISSGLQEVFKNKAGSAADINMLLIAMLRHLKIDADPVILSTRTHGLTHNIYPLMDRFNYLVAQVLIDNSTIYLDAATPRLAFGKLPLEAYNGHARVISRNMAVPIYFMTDSLKEKSNTFVIINNIENGGVEGSIKQDLGYYQSLELRDNIAKNTLEQFINTVKQSYADEAAIANVAIGPLASFDKPVSVKYDLKLEQFNNAGILYFNPMLGERIKKNPFSAAERFYPVELPYVKDDTYTLNMEIPAGYKVEELPKSVRLNLNGNDATFEYLIGSDGNNIQLRRRLIFRKANFGNEDYQSIREFYSFIVKKEAEQVVFKKIK